MQATPVALYSRRNDDPCVITFAFVQRPDGSQPDFTTAGWVIAYAGRLQDAVGTAALSATSANTTGSYVERTVNGFKLHLAHADLNGTTLPSVLAGTDLALDFDIVITDPLTGLKGAWFAGTHTIFLGVNA